MLSKKAHSDTMFSMATIDKKQIESFLTRGVENVYPSKALLKKQLEGGKKLRIYFGIDPTGPSVHIGHVIPMRKLADLQKMGHEVILLIGDFTAMIGDPSDKSATRKTLTRKEVLANCKGYKKQAEMIFDFGGKNPVKLKFNSTWLGKLSFGDVVELASHFTVQQMSERDMFEKRLQEGKPVYLHEFLYPLMQGYDSVAMDVDMEVGGNDQTFNMLAGRDLLKTKGKEKFVLTTKLLTDPTGKKMGKSEGNMITLDDAPEEMYGKVMSWTDGMILSGFELCTNVSMDEIAGIEKSMKKGENPVLFKRKLARDVVATLKGVDSGAKAEEQFDRIHKTHADPEDMQTVSLGKKEVSIVDALVISKLVSSKSDARRQIEQGGVKIDGVVIHDVSLVVHPPSVLQKGKRHFIRFIK
ncbi:MAG: tyrosine--tRNA ligase [bacterium]|nr:tyrosine--tRNA ligase [bacterium]